MPLPGIGHALNDPVGRFGPGPGRRSGPGRTVPKRARAVIGGRQRGPRLRRARSPTATAATAASARPVTACAVPGPDPLVATVAKCAMPSPPASTGATEPAEAWPGRTDGPLPWPALLAEGLSTIVIMPLTTQSAQVTVTS